MKGNTLLAIVFLVPLLALGACKNNSARNSGPDLSRNTDRPADTSPSPAAPAPGAPGSPSSPGNTPSGPEQPPSGQRG